MKITDHTRDPIPEERLSALVAIQLLLAFLNYDIQNVPDQPISAFRRRAGEP